jgi:hypothetical protein
MTTWTKETLNRRHYTVDSDGLDKAKRIEIKVIVDGKQLVHVQAREPGIVAFVSKPTEHGFEIEIVEGSGVRFTDVWLPNGEQTEPVAPWQLEALGIER